MSYCYPDDDTSSSLSSSRQHVMPESPLQTKLSSVTHNHLRRTSSDMSPHTQVEQDKRVRREIANSNERRRMQSINTGFQSLKVLIPHSCGEKLSKACILQRAADHIQSLETDKMKLQSQNEQFRVLIKSFQIDSTSVLQAQRHLSTNDPDETVILLANNDEGKVAGNNVYDDVRKSHTYWHAQYVQPSKDDQSSSQIDKYYRTVQCLTPKQSSPATTSDTAYMILKQSQPSQRCYKTNSLDQTTDNGIVIVERCQLRTQSADTPHTASRPNLQTIVEAIRHLEGDDALSNISPPASARQQEDLPAQLQAMINKKFQQTTNENSPANNSLLQQTLNIYDAPPPTATMVSHDMDLHQKPPKKRKITYNETDETYLEKQDLPPISSPDVHHHEQISSESSTVAQFLQEHFIQRTRRYSP